MRSRKSNMPTMTDVAKLAGVSQSTVSLVLTQKAKDNIPQETQARILKISRSLGYRPNALARALHGKGSGVIGCITDELVTTGFAGSIVKGAQDVAWEHEKVLMLVNLDNRREMIDDALNMLVSYQAEYIIFAAMYHHAFEVLAVPGNIPIIFVNCFDEHKKIPSVVPDDFQGAYEAVQYLINHGHCRIAYISNQLEIPATVLREDGYYKCLSDNNIQANPSLFKKINITGHDAYLAAYDLLKKKDFPTAIFCYNDRCAMGVYSAAAKLGFSIPDDISVIGYDDQTVITEFLVPPLTTMQLPHYDMGSWAVRRFFDHENSTIEKKIKPILIERESVGKL